MKYQASYAIGSSGRRADDAFISIEKEGLQLGGDFVDFAEVQNLRPINHRVFVDLFDGSSVEISMLGFSYDGFWEELMTAFGSRSLEALFIEEPLLMDCEGEYGLPMEDGGTERGRCKVQLYTDAVCILPQTSRAVRIPLCFAEEIVLEGYQLSIRMRTGEVYLVGKMGYDTKPFAERCMDSWKKTVKTRSQMLASLKTEQPFLHPGLFRTMQTEEHWAAAFGTGVCAVELYTNDQAATYLYSFPDKDQFVFFLEEAMEAVGSHREIIFLPEDQLNQNALYRMAVHRSRAVRFLRESSAGRLIHNAAHAEKLHQFLVK